MNQESFASATNIAMTQYSFPSANTNDIPIDKKTIDNFTKLNIDSEMVATFDFETPKGAAPIISVDESKCLSVVRKLIGLESNLVVVPHKRKGII